MFSRTIFRAVFGAICVLLPFVAAHADNLPALSFLQEQGARVSGAVVDLEDDRLLAELSPNRALIPASVTKLYTAALALETWGPDHRFETRLMSSTPLNEGSVQNLIFLGGGDPALTDEDLWKMARALSRAGLKRVQGDLVINNSRFGNVACNVRDRCEAERASRNAYDAPLSSAGSNYASWSIAVERDPQQGERVLTRLYPYDLPEVVVQGRIESGPGRALNARRSTVAQGQDVIELSGSLPQGQDERMLYRSAGDAEMQTGHMFRAFLQREDISVEGRIRTSRTPPDKTVELVSHRGDSLAELLAAMMRYSNNYMADTLVLNLHAEAGGQVPFSVGRAARSLQDYARRIAGENSGPLPQTPDSLLLRDGSGLDPENRLSAAALTSLLQHLYEARPDVFPAFLNSLSVPAYSSGSSLKNRDYEWLYRISVKTGGLSEPVSVTALAGYLRFKDGGWGAFAFLVNGAPGQSLSRREVFEAMRQDLSRYWDGAQP